MIILENGHSKIKSTDAKGRPLLEKETKTSAGKWSLRSDSPLGKVEVSFTI